MKDPVFNLKETVDEVIDSYGILITCQPIIIEMVLYNKWTGSIYNIGKVLPLVINKAIALNLIDNDDFTYE